MSDYALSNAADADIEQIIRHSIKEWGIGKATAYLASLHQTFANLALFPDAGKSVDELRKGYFRFPTRSHVVFYRKTATGILIVRVLHQTMPPDRHL